MNRTETPKSRWIDNELVEILSDHHKDIHGMRGEPIARTPPGGLS